MRALILDANIFNNIVAFLMGAIFGKSFFNILEKDCKTIIFRNGHRYGKL